MTPFDLGIIALILAPSAVALIALPSSPSRRKLVVALSVTIPVAGPMLAVMVSRVRGRGKLVEPQDMAADLLVTAEDGAETIRRMGDLPSLLELLLSPNSADRQSALVVLSARADAEALRILRWAVENGGPDTVLDAALTLGELDVQFEQALAEAEERFEEQPSSANALAVADTIADAIESRLVDPALAAGMARRARELYQRVIEAPDGGAADACVKLARLHLATGDGRSALKALDAAVRAGNVEELAPLYERARFLARRPDGRTTGSSLRAVPAN